LRAKIRNIFDVRKFKNIFLCFLLIQQNFRAANAMNACFFIAESREPMEQQEPSCLHVWPRREKTVRLIASRTDFVHDQMLSN